MKKLILILGLGCLLFIDLSAQIMCNVYKKQLINQEGKIVSSEVATGLFTIDLMGDFRVKSKELGLKLKLKCLTK